MISVVVPTRDRPQALERCLRSLAAQDAPLLEIVVVDDGSADSDSVADAVATLPRGLLVRTARVGPAAARNHGVRASHGEIVCFTDDDCEPEPGWARLLAAAATAGAAGGRTVNAAPGRPAACSQALTNALIEAGRDRERGELAFAPSCNLALLRELAVELPFDESYPAAAGEDREWCARAAAAGVRIVYEPRAVVHHHPKLTLASFLGQQYRYGGGSARFRRRMSSPAALGPMLPELTREGVRGGPLIGAILVAAQAAIGAGAVAERLRSVSARAVAPPRDRPRPSP